MTMRSVMAQAAQWVALVVAREVLADSQVAEDRTLKIYSAAAIFQIFSVVFSVAVAVVVHEKART
jgi:uncharacterized membrane protein